MTTPTDLTKRIRGRRTPHDSGLEEAGAVAEMFDGSRLTQARQLAGLTKRALADAVNVSAAAVGQYEAGVIRPRAELIVNLSTALDVPMQFFAFQALRPTAQVDASMAHFRSLRSMRSYERERAVAFVRQVIELTHSLEQHVRLPKVDLPSFTGSEADVPADPAAAARWIRRRWSLGLDPIPHMVRLLESKGIVVTLLPFSEAGRVNAFSYLGSGRPIVVLTTDRDDVYRHRFTAAHELGHLVMHGEAQPGDVQHEREANAFAAELLMPSAGISGSLPTRADFRIYAKQQAVWGVSVDALIYRSRELGLFGDASYRRTWQRLADLRANGLVRQESISRYPGESPSMLRRAIELAEARGYGLEALAAEVFCSTEFISNLVGMDANSEKPPVNVIAFPAKRSARHAAPGGDSGHSIDGPNEAEMGLVLEESHTGDEFADDAS